MASRGHSEIKLYRRLWSRARPYKLHLGTLLALQLLSMPLALLAPYPVKMAVDNALGTQPLPGFLEALLPTSIDRITAVLVFAVAILLLITLLSQIRELAAALLKTHTGQTMLLGFRSELFRYVQRFSFSHTDARGTTDSAYRIQHDAPALQAIATDGLIPFAGSCVTVVGMIYVSARIDWQLALVALTISPLLFLVISLYRRRLRSGSREVKRLESDALGIVQEVLGALRVVKAFGQEDRERDRFVDRSDQGVSARLRLVMNEAMFALAVALVTACGTGAVLYIGVQHVHAGILSLGDLLLVLGYLSQLYAPLKTMSRKVVRMQSNLAGAERAFELLDTTPDVHDRPDARAIHRAEGRVTFRDVSFEYGAGVPILRSIDVDIPAGSRVGIAGVTGAGKTTLVSLLPRFYDPTGGQILLDGVDLRDYKLSDLRDQFAFVLQEPILFSTSIAENIAYARPGASAAEIAAAARAAGAHEFISRLPDGYDTPVGERGMRLSGGERQRISLARAFLKDAPILVLDEPTSSVDTKTEAAIMEAVSRLMRGRTTFLITHRTSTLEVCDAVLQVKGGRLVSSSNLTSSTGAAR